MEATFSLKIWSSYRAYLYAEPERFDTMIICKSMRIRHELEQLERLRSEDTPRRPMITHTIDQFILNPKSILLTSSYIGSQVKTRWRPKN